MGFLSRSNQFRRSQRSYLAQASKFSKSKIQRRRILQAGAGLLLASLSSNCAEPVAWQGGRRIFVSAGHGGFDDRFRNLGAWAGGTTEAAEMIVTRDLLVKELRSRGFSVDAPDDALSLSDTVNWINDRSSSQDLAIEIHMGASGNADLRGVRVYYISFNEERRYHAELVLESLLLKVPQLVSRGVKPDSAAALGRLAFCRDIAPRSLFIELGFISNPVDLRLLQTYRYEMVVAIADALETIFEGKAILPAVAHDLNQSEYAEYSNYDPSTLTVSESIAANPEVDRSTLTEEAQDHSDRPDQDSSREIDAPIDHDQANLNSPAKLKKLTATDLDSNGLEEFPAIDKPASDTHPNRQATSGGLVNNYHSLHIVINDKPYAEPGILVNGNVYIPEEMATYLGIAAKYTTNMQRLNYAHKTYLRALELRNFNLSLYWDGANHTVVVKTTYRIWLGQIDRIIGMGLTSASQLLNFLRQNNDLSIREYAELPDIYRQEAAIEGVNHDIAFCQMCLETGFLRFGGDVQPQQYNFAGLGATAIGKSGDSFPNPRIGVRAHVQHLKAYASTEPLVQPLVDPRFRFITRGTAPLVGQLSGRWAIDPYYAEKIMALLRYLYETAGIL
jgi:N-acetylmuramoyl-L-alanine amidase